MEDSDGAAQAIAAPREPAGKPPGVSRLPSSISKDSVDYATVEDAFNVVGSDFGTARTKFAALRKSWEVIATKNGE